MKLGALFPTFEIGTDPGAIRDFAQGVEGLGFDHMMFFDHVLGANKAAHPGLHGPYYHTETFHEPFTLMAFLAGHTRTLGFFTSILILPQRQTVLVAKQAAEVDILSGGRLRLGVGVGWNEVEFIGLGVDFAERGRRLEEQVTVLRLLWTQELVTFAGKYHRILDAGINPLPLQRPIPIWFGGEALPVIRRVVRLADGWLPRTKLFGGWDPAKPRHYDTRDMVAKLHEFAQLAGRDPKTIGLQQFMRAAETTPDDWARHARLLRELGGTHFAIHTMDTGCTSVADHLKVIERFRDTVRAA
ncbi:MAG: LLM class F420-dependent oxidoreductase [Alphaproteobacteria bacterium]|nr:LLM class F420-dependent oxidoreductase [Alphaproteobacteria bacterium]